MVADNVAVDLKLRQYRDDKERKPGRLHRSLENKTKPAEEGEKEGRRSHISKKYLKVQFRHRHADSKTFEDVQYHPDGAVAEKLRAQKTL